MLISSFLGRLDDFRLGTLGVLWYRWIPSESVLKCLVKFEIISTISKRLGIGVDILFRRTAKGNYYLAFAKWTYGEKIMTVACSFCCDIGWFFVLLKEDTFCKETCKETTGTSMLCVSIIAMRLIFVVIDLWVEKAGQNPVVPKHRKHSVSKRFNCVPHTRLMGK